MTSEDLDLDRFNKIAEGVEENLKAAKNRITLLSGLTNDELQFEDNIDTIEQDAEQIRATVSNAKTSLNILLQEIEKIQEDFKTTPGDQQDD